MITHRYIVTGTINQTRLYLRSEGGQSLYVATGFEDKAERFRESHKAQMVADRENNWQTNGAKVWRSIEWKVVQRSFEVAPIN